MGEGKNKGVGWFVPYNMIIKSVPQSHNHRRRSFSSGWRRPGSPTSFFAVCDPPQDRGA